MLSEPSAGSPGHVREVARIYESLTSNAKDDVKSVSIRRKVPVTEKVRNSGRSSFDLLSMWLQSLAKNSNNLNSDQIRSVFFTLLNFPPLEIANKAQKDQRRSDDSNQMGEKPLVFTFTFLKNLFKFYFTHPASFLAKQPHLKITDTPKKRASVSFKWSGNDRKVKIKAGKALIGQKLNGFGVPVVVETCIDFICQYGLHAEGIYRVNGNVANVNKLIGRFKKTPKKIRMNYPKIDEYDVASALKQFIRDLPEPLIGGLTNGFLDATQLEDEAEKCKIFKTLLKQMPPAEFQTLRRLIGHLREVQLYEKENKMSAASLAIVWAQNLMTCSGADMLKYDKHKGVVLHLMVHFDALFDDDLTPDKSGETKVWIQIVTKQDQNAGEQDGNCNVRVSLANDKSVYSVCKELADDVELPAANITMIEVLLNGALKRPMHPKEVIADSVTKWAYFSSSDRENNHFVVTPTKYFYHTEELSNVKSTFIVNYTSNLEMPQLTPYTIIIEDGKIMLVDHNKRDRKLEFDIVYVWAYLGVDPKMLGGDTTNAITLFEFDEKDRNPNDPLKSHVIITKSPEARMVLYLSITHFSHAGVIYKHQNGVQGIYEQKDIIQ